MTSTLVEGVRSNPRPRPGSGLYFRDRWRSRNIPMTRFNVPHGNHQLWPLVMMLLLFVQNSYAGPMTFDMYQDGFVGGGSISGYFVGEDVNSDGTIAWHNGELYDFSADWSGNTLSPATTWELVNVFGFTYELGTGDIGAGGACCGGEGVFTNAPDGLTWISGIGPTILLENYGATPPGGIVEGLGIFPRMITPNTITVTRASVPAPSALVLISAVLLGWFGPRAGRRPTA